MGIFSNYCGLGGSGPIQHALDAICNEHDDDYDRIRRMGQDPYWSWNWADQKMMKAWKKVDPKSYKQVLLKTGANTFFGVKKYHVKNQKFRGSLANSPGKTHMPRKWTPGYPMPTGPTVYSGNDFSSIRPAAGEQKTPTMKPVNKPILGTPPGGSMGADEPNLVTPDRPTQRQRTSTEGDDIHGGGQLALPAPGDSDHGGDDSMAMVALGDGRPGRTHGDETSIDKPKYVHMRPYPDTNNTIHPYFKAGTFSITDGNTAAATNTHIHTFRLNSIWDIYFDTTLVQADDPVWAVETADATIQTPMWRGLWADKYRYWTVVKCHYTYKIWTTSTASSNGTQSTVWCYHHGIQTPPQHDIATAANTRIPDYARKTHKHCHHKTITSHASVIGNHNPYTTQIVFNGSYHPGHASVHNSVAEDEHKQTWHQIQEVPPLREAVSFITQHSDKVCGTQTAAPGMSFSWTMEMVFQVQWKDLARKYQYPTPGDDLTAITNFMDQRVNPAI